MLFLGGMVFGAALLITFFAVLDLMAPYQACFDEGNVREDD